MTNASIAISMSCEEYDTLGAIAQKRGVPRSAVMRHAFRLYMQLQEMEKNGDQLFAVDQKGERQLKIVGFVPPLTHLMPRVVDNVRRAK